MWEHGKQTVSERDKLNNERMKTITRKKKHWTKRTENVMRTWEYKWKH